MVWFRSRANGGFKSRSSIRDTETDQHAITSISAAIDAALKNAEAEQAGLRRRLDHVISHAALAGGNDVEDYATRSDSRIEMLSISDADIKQGEGRLAILESHIANFRFLQTELRARFPQVKASVR